MVSCQPFQDKDGSNCPNLSQEEQAFASKLSELNQDIFCDHFTHEQREEAMNLVKTNKDCDPNYAIEKILRTYQNSFFPLID